MNKLNLNQIRHNLVLKMPHKQCSWTELIEACGVSDTLALTTLDEFCSHVTAAVNNMLKLLDIRTMIIGYEAAGRNTVLEGMMQAHLNANLPTEEKITLSTSHFLDKASLYGSLAVICNMVFDGNILLCRDL